jgi:hypothetical protein
MAKRKQDEREQSGCIKFIMFVVAVILLLMIPLTLLAFATGMVVFSPRIVKEEASKAIVESDIIPLGLEWFSEWRADQRVEEGLARPNETEPDIVQMLAYLNASHWSSIRAEVLPDEILISWVHSAIDGVYAWIDNDNEFPTIILNIKDFKAVVKTEHGNNAIMIAYSALPPCTEDQIVDMLYRLSLVPPGTEVLYNLCQFPNIEGFNFGDDQVSDYWISLQQVVENLPDEYNLVERMNEDQLELLRETNPLSAKRILRLIRFIMRWSLALPVLTLAVLALFATRARRPGAWLGVPLIGGGLMGLILAILYRLLITVSLTAPPLERVPPLVLEEGTQFLFGLAGHIFTWMLIISAVFIALGFIFLIAARGRKRREEEDAYEQDLVGGVLPAGSAQPTLIHQAAPPAGSSAPTTASQPAAPTVQSPAATQAMPVPKESDEDTKEGGGG